MRFDLENLPSDTSILHALVRDMAAALEADRSQLGEAKGEIERLKTIIRELQRARFGRRSEQLDADQLALGLEDLDADVARLEEGLPADIQAPIEIAGETRSARSLPDHLARSEIIIDVDGNACPCCGGALHLIGESVSEMLDWVPAELRVLRIRRPKYACRSCGTAHQAAAPERAIAKGMATPKLLAQVLTAKFCDHLPLYRQAQIFARHGVPMQRSTLSNWVGGACWWLEPLHERLLKMSSLRRSFLRTTLRSASLIPAAAARKPADCGLMRGTTGHGAGLIRRPPSTSTVLTARASTPLRISKVSRASCRSTDMPGLNN